MDIHKKKKVNNEEVSVCFRLLCNDIVILKLSKLLGINPTFSRTKNNCKLWGFVVPVERTKKLESHIEWLNNLLNQRKHFLEIATREKVQMDILISCHYPTDIQTGFTLPVEFSNICGKFGIGLNFDIYTYTNF